jgi:hypothetical protein
MMPSANDVIPENLEEVVVLTADDAIDLADE